MKTVTQNRADSLVWLSHKPRTGKGNQHPPVLKNVLSWFVVATLVACNQPVIVDDPQPEASSPVKVQLTKPEPPPAADQPMQTISPERSAVPLVSRETERLPTEKEPPASPLSAETPPQNVEDPDPCQALELDPSLHRKWLLSAIEKNIKRAKGAERSAFLDLAKQIDTALGAQDDPDAPILYQEGMENTALGLRFWFPDHVDNERTFIWASGIESDNPIQGNRGCWAIIRTGVSSIIWVERPENAFVVLYDYAIAFSVKKSRVSKIKIPVFSWGIDARNLLTIQDTDGDGWEEAFYTAADGWEGEDHESYGDGINLWLSAKGGVLRKRPPIRKGSSALSQLEPHFHAEQGRR